MVEVSKETLLFVTEEVLVVHSICDRAGVPRLNEGETLSMSQRVHILDRCYCSLVKNRWPGTTEECH